MTKDSKPLTGIRVLDIACFIAAPHAATIMGEFGADVIKVEHPNGCLLYTSPSPRDPL